MRTADGEVVEQRVDRWTNAALLRAASEIPCPRDEMSVEILGAGGYRVEGCGTRVTYTCVSTPRSALCDLRERQAVPQAVGALPDRERIADPLNRWLVEVYERLVACLPSGTDRARIRIDVDTTGGVRRTGRSVLGIDANACLDDVLASSPVRRFDSPSRTVAIELARGAAPPYVEPVGPDLAGAPATQDPTSGDVPDAPADPAPVPRGGASIEPTVRAAVDARAPAILACVDETAVALQVSWSRDGHLDALLRGERQGTPEEACVRAIVQAITVAAPGSPGTIVHAVQR